MKLYKTNYQSEDYRTYNKTKNLYIKGPEKLGGLEIRSLKEIENWLFDCSSGG